VLDDQVNDVVLELHPAAALEHLPRMVRRFASNTERQTSDIRDPLAAAPVCR
jgi:hypothetical protein